MKCFLFVYCNFILIGFFYQSTKVQDSMSLGSFRGIGSSAGPQSDRLSAMKAAFSVSFTTCKSFSLFFYNHYKSEIFDDHFMQDTYNLDAFRMMLNTMLL